MSGLFGALSRADRERLRARSQPDWIEPMLATLTDDRFSDTDWIYERKLDGVRCLVFRDGEAVRLLSRNRTVMNETWPELVEAIEREPCRDFVADGEIVAFEGARTSFSRLQGRIGIQDADRARRTGIAVTLYLFDLLHVQGRDTRRLPLRRRKVLLKRALSFEGPIRFTPHRNETGEAYLEEACRKGWEGLIAKDARAAYETERSRRWLKFKCVHRQELVIGGFTDPKGSRSDFGALLVGHFEGRALRYAGKVGTGYDEATLADLGGRLRDLERERSPFCDAIGDSDVHFVRPELVGEFGFTEWTDDGKLRHPRFLGLRPDKPARKVHRERPRRSGET
ncbi:MAG: non-homologous end-joining DNA ligase [Myxococcota bacterium]